MRHPIPAQKLVTAFSVAALTAALMTGCSAEEAAPAASPGSPTASSAEGGIALLPKDSAIAGEVPAAYQGRELTWGSGTQVPYTTLGADGAVTGLSVDLAAQLSSVMGVKIKLVNAPLDTVIPGLQSGRFDLGGPNGDYLERQALVDFSDFAQSNATFLVQAKGSFQPKALIDVCGKKVGIEKGAATLNTINAINAGQCTKNGKPPATVLTYADDSAAVLALKSGRIDTRLDPIAPNSLAAASSNGQLTSINLKEIISLPGASSTYGIASKKGAGLADAVTAALQVIYNEGVYQKLFEKYEIPGSAVPLDRVKTNGSTQKQAG